jgi:hypothetical protein
MFYFNIFRPTDRNFSYSLGFVQHGILKRIAQATAYHIKGNLTEILILHCVFKYIIAKDFVFGEISKMEGYLIHFKLDLKVLTECAYSR